jgi:hypothetical protein
MDWRSIVWASLAVKKVVTDSTEQVRQERARPVAVEEQPAGLLHCSQPSSPCLTHAMATQGSSSASDEGEPAAAEDENRWDIAWIVPGS